MLTTQKLVHSSWFVVRGLFILVLFLLTMNYLLPTVHAQTPCDPAKGPCSITADLYNASTHSDFTIINLQQTIIKVLSGQKLTDDPSVELINTGGVIEPKITNFSSGGALQSLGGIMVAMYKQPPSSSTYYLAHLGENLGIVDPVYAQVGGSGNSIIQPVFALWEMVRNIAYLAFIIVFVVVGFMIMFRRKISPQAVISAQQALPSLVIGLILVTFSYFVAALVIDIVFLGTDLVAQLFKSSVLTGLIFKSDPVDLAQNSGLFDLFAASGLSAKSLGSILYGVINQLNASVANLDINLGFTTISPYGIVSGILIVVLLIALFVQLFRLLFDLVKSYIQILVFTIIGPLLVVFGSIPGSGGAITYWWKNLLANALVFPAVFAGFLFAGVILGTNNTSFTVTLPLFGGTDATFIKTILAFGILLGLPAIPGMIKKAMKVEDLTAIGKEAAEGAKIGAGFAAPVGLGLSRFGIKLGYNRLGKYDNQPPPWQGPIRRGLAAGIKGLVGKQKWFQT